MDKHTKKCLTIIGIIIISMACVPVVKEDTDPSYFVNIKKNDFTISEKGDVVDVYITSNYDNIYVEDMSPFFAGRVKKSSHNDGNFPAPANTEHKVYYYTFSIEATYNDDGEEIDRYIYVSGRRNVTEKGEKKTVGKKCRLTFHQKWYADGSRPMTLEEFRKRMIEGHDKNY